MSDAVVRPCAAIDLVDLTPKYKGGWGAPLAEDPVPWSKRGMFWGFDFVATVHSDSDWDSLALDPNASFPLRYVIVPLPDGWELRLGRTSPEAHRANVRNFLSFEFQSGFHRHMFSQGEQQRAEQQGQPIRSGYIYGIESDHITIDRLDPAP